MATKIKTFDCVKMKNRLQARHMAGYMANRDRYPTFVDSIYGRRARSEWVQRMEAKFAKKSHPT